MDEVLIMELLETFLTAELISLLNQRDFEQ